MFAFRAYPAPLANLRALIAKLAVDGTGYGQHELILEGTACDLYPDGQPLR
jgi:hypothetical protein